MAAWTDEQKASLIEKYLAANPTPANSIEIVKQLAEEFEQSANGTRMVLSQAQVYVKKEAGASTEKATTTKADGDAPKRVSKESQINALKEAITAKGVELDAEVLDKLTGKAAAYFTKVLAA
jgi:hypothetical protein